MTRESNLGISAPRIDGYIKVTGRAKYITDLSRPGMLYGKILFSDRPHARIIHIDTSAAQSMPGVHAVITSTDTPNILYGLYLRDRLIFAKGKVRHIGEPIAAVAAESENIALQALQKIQVTYEDLPAVFDPFEALKPDAPIIHPDVESYQGIYPFIKYGNVCMDAEVNHGDIVKGFAEADVIVEGTYHTSAIHQSSIEPHACLAEFDHWHRLTVWTGTQQLTLCHQELASALGLPMTKVRVIPAWLGGGFGGKLKSLFEQICALLAIKSDRPVKIELTREEEFICTHARGPQTIYIKTGAKKDGTLVAREVRVVADMGGYSDHALGMATHAITFASGVYAIPNVRGHALAVYTNNPDWGCMRGYGGSEITFAGESQLDLLAEKLSIDPADLRLKNLYKDGDTFITTQKMDCVNIHDTMQAALQTSGYRKKKGQLAPNHGIGIANSILNTGFLSSSVVLRANPDGTVSLLTSVTDLGTGNLTALCQIVAEALGLPFDKIGVASQDSDSSPYDTGSIASRTVFDAGNAIILAAVDIIHQLIKLAALAFECDEEDVIYEEGAAFRKSQPEIVRSFAELVSDALFVSGGPLIGRGATLANPPHKHEIGRGFAERPAGTFTFATHVAEVYVDPETGSVCVTNYTAAHDVGKVINTDGIEGQVEGGVIQGLGWALYEELVYPQGKIINPNFVDYKIPTALDTPPIIDIFIEKPALRGPFGAKGMSEPPMVPPMAAISNAIFDACGAHVQTIPINLERLYNALHPGNKSD
ncbi:MAG: xanthine dehydrogenase family protein molybdopterin-binding subunit [Leptolinea sp.]